MHIMALTQPCPRGWLNERDQTTPGYTQAEFWKSLAKTCERGLLDALFIADIMGIYDSYKGSWKPAVHYAVQAPHDDPTFVAATMAAVTDKLCFGVTWNTSLQSPYYTAKAFTTLDHLTGGRIGWNIVTGYVKNVEENGMGQLLSHDERYEQADEFMDVVYKLWEHSWEDDAVVRDRGRRMHADPARVHEIHHKGKYFSVKGPHICEPSLQRTPVLLQAGGSSRGMAFGGKHAEALFTINPTPEKAAEAVKKARQAAVAAGRQPSDVKVLAGVCPIVGRTNAEAKEKYHAAREAVSLEAAFTLFGGWTGVDLSAYDPDARIETLESGMQSLIKNFTHVDPGRAWRVRDLGEWLKGGTIAPDIVGSAKEIADELERWMRVAGVDGFMVQPYTTPGSHEDFVDLVIPELQARGLFRTRYEGDTFRERLGGNARLPQQHPARNVVIG
jgi:FMN-dependent oxidoreductase (nitrilotriacetate monooxygenase family)